MASSLLVMGGNVVITANTNRYTNLSNGRIDQTFFGRGSTDIIWPVAATFKNLGCSISDNSRTGLISSSLGVVLYVNGVASALSTAIAEATDDHFVNSVDSVTIAAGDAISLRWSGGNSTGTGSYTVRNVWIEIENASPITLHLAASVAALGPGTQYPPLAYGSYPIVSPESISQMPSIAGTWHDLYQLVTSNSRNGDATIDFREGGATGNQGITIPASTTGTYIDTATDVVAEDDLVNLISVRDGTTGTVSVQVGCDFFTSDDDRFQIYASGDLALSPGGATNYYLPLGGLSNASYGDDETRIIWPLTGKQLEILNIRITVNDVAATSYLDLMVNGSAVESVPITASTTGTFSLTATRALDDGDEVNLRLRAGGAGNITVRFCRSVWGNAPTGRSGNIAQIMPMFTQAAGGKVSIAGEIAQTFKMFSQAGSGNVDVGGDIAQTFKMFTQALTGSVPATGNIAQVMPMFNQSLVGSVPVAGNIAQVMPMFTQALTEADVISGNIAQVMPMFTQALSNIVQRWQKISLVFSEEQKVKLTTSNQKIKFEV